MEPLLFPHQQEAISKMHNGCILCGGVGTGKSMTGLGYYFYKVSNSKPVKPLIIITTAHKRDSKEWEMECIRWGIPSEYDATLTIDSWNNIEKYIDVTDSFFIFDEHKAIGSGKWAKCFVKISRNNKWILLTATPGDNWMDYISVFIANGFYKNRTDFIRHHVIVNPYVSYFSVKDYIDVERLKKCRDAILVNMPYKKIAEKEEIQVLCDYDELAYKTIYKDRWNIYEGQPIENASEMCYLLRKCCNSHESRIKKLLEILKEHKKVIIFYNFDYELELLLKNLEGNVTQWNGHAHEEILDTETWCHLVQYSAGAEGWNCITTDTIIFYSLSYSYKMTEQAMGRIDRMNTPFSKLYYYRLFTNSDIDKAINLSLAKKKDFNADKFARENFMAVYGQIV